MAKKKPLKHETTTVTRTEHVIRLDGDGIRDLLVRCSEMSAGAIPQVTFTVPSGGDYSGMVLDLDHPGIEVRVTWTDEFEED